MTNLSELAKAHAETTQGEEWHVVKYGDGDTLVICTDPQGDNRVCFMPIPGQLGNPKVIEANARFIALAHKYVPELIERVEATEKLAKAARALMGACNYADALEELHEAVDGSLMDAVSEALEELNPIVFTEAQVQMLERFQSLPMGHRLTCGGDRGDEAHRWYANEHGEDMGQLVPTIRGLICPVCEYRQTQYPAVVKGIARTTLGDTHEG